MVLRIRGANNGCVCGCLVFFVRKWTEERDAIMAHGMSLLDTQMVKYRTRQSHSSHSAKCFYRRHGFPVHCAA